MRKELDDAIARTVAENAVADVLGEQFEEPDRVAGIDGARGVLGAFPAVEFERSATKIRGGAEIHLRRLVITGPWEVDPNGGK